MTLSRRQLLAALGASLLVPALARAQQGSKIPRIGWLGGSSRSGDTAYLNAFRAGMRELGYIEGKNLVVEYRWADDDVQRLPALAAELAGLKVDVIVTYATPGVEAAKSATATIPIVMAATADAVGTGLVASLAHPGGNVTGQTSMVNELIGRRLQILQDLLPGANRIAVLALAKVGGTRELQKTLTSIARKRKLKLIVREFAAPGDWPHAFETMKHERAQALIVQSSPLTIGHRSEIVTLAAKSRIPAIYESALYVDDGGLMAYGPDFLDMYRRSATFVDKILKGAKPGDLPVEQPTDFELTVNLKTARTLGIKIPNSILVQATRVIE